MEYKLDLIAELPGHEDRAWNIAWNPNKPLLASCSADKSVRLHAYNPDRAFSHISTISTGHTKTVRSIGWTPCGKTLATASFDSNIGIWEQDEQDEEGNGTGEWECVTMLEGHENECKCVAYSSEGNLLASCSRDKTVWVWEVHPDADFECLGVMMDHTQDVKSVAWHPTQEILASASYDNSVKLYIDDPDDDWFCYCTLTGHESTVWSVCFAPNGSYLASSSDDKTVRIWRKVNDQRWVADLILEGHERSVYSVSWGKGAQGTLGWIASTGGDGQVRIWEIKESTSSSSEITSKLIAVLKDVHGVSDVNAISWCPREGFHDLLATAGDDGIVRVWRVVPHIS